MAVRSVKVSNISASATEQDLREFLTFPGKIDYIEIKSDNGNSKVAFVTFTNPEGAETAVLLSGAVVSGQSLNIDLAPEYDLPASAASATQTGDAENAGSSLRKAEDVVSTMLAKGFILGKDAVNRAKAFDEKHQLTSTATAKVVSLDQKVGLSEKISAGTVLVNDKVKEMDEKYQVSEKTKSALTAAEQSVSNAGSAIMKNRYVLTGATWVTGAYNKVAKAAEEVGQKTKEKVLAQDNQEKTEDHLPTTTSEATTPSQSSKPELQQTTTTDQPSKPESQEANMPNQTSKPEPQQATTPNQPSNLEPQQATIPNQPSNPEPQQATVPDQLSKPEPQQATKDGQPSNPATTQGLTL